MQIVVENDNSVRLTVQHFTEVILQFAEAGRGSLLGFDQARVLQSHRGQLHERFEQHETDLIEHAGQPRRVHIGRAQQFVLGNQRRAHHRPHLHLGNRLLLGQVRGPDHVVNQNRAAAVQHFANDRVRSLLFGVRDLALFHIAGHAEIPLAVFAEQHEKTPLRSGQSDCGVHGPVENRRRGKIPVQIFDQRGQFLQSGFQTAVRVAAAFRLAARSQSVQIIEKIVGHVCSAMLPLARS